MNKNKTIGELLDEARQKSGAAKLAGHDIMDLERFAPDCICTPLRPTARSN